MDKSDSVMPGEGSVDSDNLENLDGVELIEFEYEEEATFKRLAEDIYESEEAGIREILLNAYTYVIKSHENGYIDEDKGVVTVEAKKESDGSVTLVIQDNGMGISLDKVENIMTQIGKSEVRYREDLGGKFGMGFLALYMLVGLAGAFNMHSNSRENENPSYSGVWTSSDGFNLDKENTVLDNYYNDDEYGTRFEVFVKNDITISDIRKWVKKYSRYSRVPVVYEEKGPEGDTTRSEEWGEYDVSKKFEDSDLTLEVENEYFKAIASPEALNDTIMLDIPVTRTGETKRGTDFRMKHRNTDWKVDIRFKSENSTVVHGPNKGKHAVRNSDYNSIPPELKSQYITKNETDTEDVILPAPTGTRDTIERRREFWKWLWSRMENRFMDKVEEALDKLGSLDVRGLTEQNFAVLKLYSREYISHDAQRQDVKEALNKTLGYNTPFGRGFDLMYYLLSDGNLRESVRRSLFSEEDFDVFIGCSINEMREQVVQEHNSKNIVTSVETAKCYDLVQELFGFKLLKNVTDPSDYDISEELKERFEQSIGHSENVENQRSVVRYSPNSSRENVTMKKIKNAFEEDDVKFEKRAGFGRYSRYPPQYLILFPESSEYNISDYYWLGNRNIGITRVNAKQREYLLQIGDRVKTISEYINNARTTTVKTSRGNMTIPEAKSRTAQLVVHVTLDSTISYMRDDETIKGLEKFANSKEKWGALKKTVDSEEIIYLPLSLREIHDFEPLLDDVVIIEGDCNYYGPNKTKLKLDSDVQAYAFAELRNIDGVEEELNFLTNCKVSLDQGGIEIIEKIKNQN